MIVEKNKLISLLLHQDENVRNESVYALGRFFPHAGNVTSHLLKAIKKYNGKSLSLASNLRKFVPNDDDIRDIVALLNDISNKSDDYSFNLDFNLQKSFFYFPFKLLKKNYTTLSFNNDLKNNFNILEKREEIKSQKHEVLWKELYELCLRNKGKRIDNNELQYADVLLEGLSKNSDSVKHKVVMFLSQEITDNFYFEEYMVKLAGILKITETIPFLFRIFVETDYIHTVNQSCIESLGKIGSIKVVEDANKLYRSNKILRDRLSGIFKYIPYDFSENAAIQLLESEQDVDIKTFLADSLCGIFSLKASDSLIDMIKNRQYNASILSLSDLIIPIFAYHNKDIDLTELCYKDKQFSQETFNNDPLRKSLEPIREIFNKLEKSEKINRSNSDEINTFEAKRDNIIPIKKSIKNKKLKKRKKKKK